MEDQVISADDREFLRSSIAEVLAEHCDRRSLHRHVDGAADLVKPLRERAGELGWLGIGVREASGGLGFGADGLVLLSLELGRQLAPGPFIPSLAAAQLIDEFAPEDVQHSLLPGLILGEASASMSARLSPAPDGAEDLLLGDWTCGAPLVLAAQSRTQGVRLLSCATPEAPTQAGWDATRQLARPPENAVLVRDLPPEAADRFFVLANLLVAADSIGLMHGIFDQTVDYLNTREQFGVKIGSFQALKHRAADLAARIELNECLLEQAVESAGAWAVDAGMWSAVCKASATDAAVFLTQECLQLHGGIGFTWEYDCHLFLKRARLNQMLVGDNATLRAEAFDDLADATRSGLSPLEIAS